MRDLRFLRFSYLGSLAAVIVVWVLAGAIIAANTKIRFFCWAKKKGRSVLPLFLSDIWFHIRYFLLLFVQLHRVARMHIVQGENDHS